MDKPKSIETCSNLDTVLLSDQTINKIKDNFVSEIQERKAISKKTK